MDEAFFMFCFKVTSGRVQSLVISINRKLIKLTVDGVYGREDLYSKGADIGKRTD